MDNLTPIRRQYLDVKRRYPHAIVFFRLGDFYETFDDDAELCSRELDLTLTSKPMGHPHMIDGGLWWDSDHPALPWCSVPANCGSSWMRRSPRRASLIGLRCDSPRGTDTSN